MAVLEAFLRVHYFFRKLFMYRFVLYIIVCIFKLKYNPLKRQKGSHSGPPVRTVNNKY